MYKFKRKPKEDKFFSEGKYKTSPWEMDELENEQPTDWDDDDQSNEDYEKEFYASLEEADRMEEEWMKEMGFDK